MGRWLRGRVLEVAKVGKGGQLVAGERGSASEDIQEVRGEGGGGGEEGPRTIGWRFPCFFPPPASSKFHKTTTVNCDCQSPVTGLNMLFTPLISNLQVHVNWLEKENTRQSTWSQRSQTVATYVGQEWEWRAMWWSPLSLLSHLMVWRCAADLFTNIIIKHTIHFVVNEPHLQD